jgi:hypothetical protein
MVVASKSWALTLIPRANAALSRNAPHSDGRRRSFSGAVSVGLLIGCPPTSGTRDARDRAGDYPGRPPAFAEPRRVESVSPPCCLLPQPGGQIARSSCKGHFSGIAGPCCSARMHTGFARLPAAFPGDLEIKGVPLFRGSPSACQVAPSTRKPFCPPMRNIAVLSTHSHSARWACAMSRRKKPPATASAAGGLKGVPSVHSNACRRLFHNSRPPPSNALSSDPCVAFSQVTSAARQRAFRYRRTCSSASHGRCPRWR